MSHEARPSPRTGNIVPPGDETGVYYIAFANLPFHSTWQDFKDYIRQAADVDYVMIFPKSTSGWVRVLKRENFERAVAHMLKVPFEGGTITNIWFKTNEAEPLMIRDLHKVSKPGSEAKAPALDPGVASFSPGTPSDYPLDYGEAASPAKYTSSASYYGQGVSTATYSLPIRTAAGTAPYQSSAPAYYGHPCSTANQPAGPDYGYGAYPAQVAEYYHYDDGAAKPSDPTGGAAKRRIVVRDIPIHASEEEVRWFILDTIGGADAMRINRIRAAEGHVNVSFMDAEVAVRAKARLSQREFMGKELRVSLVADGASKKERKERKERDGEKDKDKDKKKDKEKTQKDKDKTQKDKDKAQKKDKDKTHKKGEAIIADGSHGRGC